MRAGTLSEYVYLEHGAHWAIGLLAVIMLVSVDYDIPEVVTGLTGVGFIVAALSARWPSAAPAAATLDVDDSDEVLGTAQR